MFKITKSIKIQNFKGFKEYLSGHEYIILFYDGLYKPIFDKSELIREIEKDLSGKISYIFDMADRIILNKDIIVEDLISEKIGGE